MKKLLDNPDTMSSLEVIRALRIRHIYNAEDMWAMEIMTLLIFLCVSTLLWLIFINTLNVGRTLRMIFGLSSAFFTTLVGIKIAQAFHRLYSDVQASEHVWDLQRLFYLCDGIVIIIAHQLGISYEAFNVLLFGVVQPLLILILGFMVLKYQGKHLNWRHENQT